MIFLIEYGYQGDETIVHMHHGPQRLTTHMRDLIEQDHYSSKTMIFEVYRYDRGGTLVHLMVEPLSTTTGPDEFITHRYRLFEAEGGKTVFEFTATIDGRN